MARKDPGPDLSDEEWERYRGDLETRRKKKRDVIQTLFLLIVQEFLFLYEDARTTRWTHKNLHRKGIEWHKTSHIQKNLVN